VTAVAGVVVAAMAGLIGAAAAVRLIIQTIRVNMFSLTSIQYKSCATVLDIKGDVFYHLLTVSFFTDSALIIAVNLLSLLQEPCGVLISISLSH
jgi:hypothetical protein